MNRVAISILLVLLISITIGCIKIVPSEPTSTEKTIEGDQFSKYDLDNDGQDDRYVYKFATEEIASDVFLDRTLDYDKSGAGYQGKIILQFDDRSNGKTDYEHIENIPKEFAAHVDELEFSVPPDEIINPDPNVKWQKHVIDFTADGLINITKKIPERSPERLVEDMARIAIVYNNPKLEDVATKRGPELDKYILQKALELKGMLPDIYTGDSAEDFALCGLCSQRYIKAACFAILSGNPLKWCVTSNLVEKESDKDMCKGIYIQHDCQDITDKAAREKCYFTQAIELNCEIACYQITDSDNQNLCLAGVKNDASYCEQIKDPETKKKCLEALGVAPEQKDQPGGLSELEEICRNCPDCGGQYYDKCYKCINGKPVTFDCSEWEKYFPSAK